MAKRNDRNSSGNFYRSRAKQHGLHMNVEGLEGMIDGLQRGSKDLPDVFRAVLRGPGGEAIASEVRQRLPKRTGATARDVAVRDVSASSRGGMFGRESVEVGLSEYGEHPRGRRPFQLIGRLIESGAKPHEITARRGGLAGVVGFRKSVEHPGFRGRRTMARSLRAVKWEVEAALVDELTTRRWAQEGT